MESLLGAALTVRWPSGWLSPARTLALLCVAGYLGLVRTLRHKRVKYIDAELDPKANAHEIFVMTGLLEFPFIFEKSVEFALFKTYASPYTARSESRRLCNVGRCNRFPTHPSCPWPNPPPVQLWHPEHLCGFAQDAANGAQHAEAVRRHGAPHQGVYGKQARQ